MARIFWENLDQLMSKQSNQQSMFTLDYDLRAL